MSKSPCNQRCVHCLSVFDTLTWDHIPPASWYPDTTPEAMEKWKVPCCYTCNQELSRIEKELLIKMGLCIAPNTNEAQGIADKALRSLKPELGKGERDKSHRAKARQKVIRHMMKFQDKIASGVLPNFGPHESSEEPIAVLIPAEYVERFSRKLVRGFTYIIDGEYIEEDYEIDVFFVQDEAANEIMQLIDKHGITYNQGPGLIVKRAVAADDSKSAMWAISIWDKLKIYATVKKRYNESI